jgi:hypothetical protein
LCAWDKKTRGGERQEKKKGRETRRKKGWKNKLFGLDLEVVLTLFDEDLIVILVEDQSGKLGKPGEDVTR